MLSVTKFERQNGHEPTVTPFEAGQFKAHCVCACGKYLQTIYGHARNSESRALESLRDAVLAAHGLIVIERSNWACAECGSMRGLSAHHKVFRSHGRDDTVANLESVCLVCHEEKHRKKSEVRPADIARTP